MKVNRSKPVSRMSPQTAITIYPSVRKLLLILIGCAPFAIGGVAIVVGPVYAGLTAFYIVVAALFGGVCVALFGGATVYLTYRLLVRQPVLVVDDDGILVRWPPMPVEPIPWTEIETVGSYYVGGFRSLGLVLRDRKAFIRRQPWPRRWLLAMGASDEPPIGIEQFTLPIDVYTLEEQIKTEYGHKFESAAQERAVAPIEPCRLEFHLTRRQRFMAHLGVWAPFLPIVLILLGGGIAMVVAISIAVSLWLMPLILVPLWFARRSIGGFLNVLVVRSQHCDIDIEENGLRCETEAGSRIFGVFVPFDTIIRISRYSRDTWTLSSADGAVVSIPVDAIQQQYVDHIRARAGLE